MSKRKHAVILVLAGVLSGQCLPASAQTRVDLRTQSKRVDFTNADSTKPIKAGTVLPPTCTAGELFLDISVPASLELYGCTANNTWVPQGGTTTIENDGVNVGTRATQNFITGTGLVTVISDTGTKVNIQQGADTAVMESRANAQSGTTLLCVSSGGSSPAFTCSMNPTLNGYSAGMAVQWRPSADGSGVPITLNIDTLGAKPVKLADGVTNPTAADLAAGRQYALWYDGSTFRLQAPAMMAGSAGGRPGCDAAQRGRIWQVLGGGGVKDELAVCAKDAAGAYDWRVLY
jgi:hypothetical protein